MGSCNPLPPEPAGSSYQYSSNITQLHVSGNGVKNVFFAGEPHCPVGRQGGRFPSCGRDAQLLVFLDLAKNCSSMKPGTRCEAVGLSHREAVRRIGNYQVPINDSWMGTSEGFGSCPGCAPPPYTCQESARGRGFARADRRERGKSRPAYVLRCSIR